MKGEYGKMMGKLQKMQEAMGKMEEELAEAKIEASSGGGMVKVTVNGNQEVLKVQVDPGAVDPSDVELLEDMVLTAINDGMRQSKELAQQKMGRISGGLGLPGL
ncbi:MAG: YbaB/EbfC family nucleoid-associated protein [Terriglobia bacterium]